MPFRAKDVPAQAAQFAHADICIGLTQLSYYYSGLSDSQLDQLFESLTKDSSRDSVYEQWVEQVVCCRPREHLDPSILVYSSLNLADSCQKHNHLYPAMRMVPMAIDYWLCKHLFPREAKEFQYKLSTSAWDLCTLNDNLTTGFSGTNDSRILLPTSMSYHEVAELSGTSGRVLANLLSQSTARGKKHCCYEWLPFGDETNTELNILACAIRNGCSVLLDVGALILKLSNQQVAAEWLKMSNVEAAVFVNNNNELVVLERASGLVAPFETSIYKQQLAKCVIYLDEIHTRGTDLKIAPGDCALVTLGRGLSKDRLVQACMRMRMLGVGHFVHFLASHEVNNAIRGGIRTRRGVKCLDVIEWSIDNR